MGLRKALKLKKSNHDINNDAMKASIFIMVQILQVYPIKWPLIEHLLDILSIIR